MVSYTDASDNAIVAEVSKSLTAATVSGSSTNKVQTAFTSSASEGLFGLGQHQDGVVNKKGKQVHFHNVNNNTQGSATQGGDITIPLLVSSKGYGIFWDNAADGDFFGNDSSNTTYRFSSNAGDMVDYYFMYGPTIDQVIACYRTATGAAPLFPKWAYGLFHSKDAYGSQSELLAVKDGYRNAKIPVDCIVQDWNYWTPYGQGSHLMDPSRYPDPAKLISDMHTANVHAMISIWPRYELKNNPAKVTGENDNYNALKNINALFMGGTPGYPPPYDTFNAEARTLVYQQIYDRPARQVRLGRHLGRRHRAGRRRPQHGRPPPSARASSTSTPIPCEHSRRLYEGWRKVGPNNKRVYVLTRSGFGGQQRYAASVLVRGHQLRLVDPSQADAGRAQLRALRDAVLDHRHRRLLRAQRRTGPRPQNNELFTRWFQFGAFCSLFRIHGGGARELYGNQWSATTKANLLLFDNLHYRLMPYIYSLAWKVTSEGYTIMRPLVFDFQSDTKVFDIKDQFMYRPCLPRQSGDHGGRHQPVRLSAGRHLVRFLDGRDEQRRDHLVGERAAESHPALRPSRVDRADGAHDPVRDREHRPAGDPDLQGWECVVHPLRGRGRHLQLRDRQVLDDSIHLGRRGGAADDRRPDRKLHGNAGQQDVQRRMGGGQSRCRCRRHRDRGSSGQV